MADKKIAAGVVHDVSDDLRRALLGDNTTLLIWEDLTPLSRNEWICWVEDAKRIETRLSRIERLLSQLKDGKRRPCCWAGCPHRIRSGKADDTGPK